MSSENILKEIISKLNEEFGEIHPKISIICGSGWGDIVESFSGCKLLEYSQIPGFSRTTISGHAGKLGVFKIGNEQIIVFQGRKHYYEGEGWDPVKLPVLLAHALGAEILFLTNAAGGINPQFKVGDLMLIQDHINMMGSNPLIGPTQPNMPRFPDQSNIYNPNLLKYLMEISDEMNLKVHQGNYLALSGPAFETPAEIQACKTLGADAVGMSTVPEAMIGNALGMKIVGLSCITNLAAGLASHELSHLDVSTTAKKAMPDMKNLVLRSLKELVVQ